MNTLRRLHLNPAELPEDLSREHLVWRDPPGPSSFHSSLRPSLSELGAVPALSRDAVWLTTTVFLADRTIKRPRSKTRDITLRVPVSSPASWTSQADEIQAILAEFTSDNWHVEFQQAPEIDVSASEDDSPVEDLVCLLSGGADSLCGAVKAIHDGRTPILVSHWDTNAHKPIQIALADGLRELFDVDLQHLQIHLAKARKQITGQGFPDEWTRRGRSLLFLTLGLAQGAARDISELWIPENGWASLNPPLAPERIGAMSTRTTDPRLLRRFDEVLASVGANHGIINPFERQTKGEMFSYVAAILGEEQASQLLSATHSCSHSRLAGGYGKPLSTQCGTCFGCLLRRAAFRASGLEDRTAYLDTSLSGRDLTKFRDEWSDDLRAMRYAAARGVQDPDLLALQLPDGFDLDDARSLVTRGFNELEAVVR